MPKNWKTTLAGFLGGALTAWAGGMDLKSVVIGAAIAAVGTAAKDHDGVTVVKPPV